MAKRMSRNNKLDMSNNHFRDIINHRLRKIKKSRYWLVRRAGSSEAVVYRFLSGDAETTSDNVRSMLNAVGIELVLRDGFNPELL